MSPLNVKSETMNFRAVAEKHPMLHEIVIDNTSESTNFVKIKFCYSFLWNTVVNHEIDGSFAQ